MNKGSAQFNFHLTKDKKEREKYVKRVPAQNVPAQRQLDSLAIALARSPALYLGRNLKMYYRRNTSIFRNITQFGLL
jgi:hypothetical protein